MAKRGAELQINKDNPGDDNGNGSWGATSGPPKATAAQLANRSLYAIETLVKRRKESHITPMLPAESPAKLARLRRQQEANAAYGAHRMNHPRGGRRTPVSSSRRPLPSALSNQKQLPAFGQTNGTALSNSGGSPLGQQQPPASQSFPPFGYNSTGSGNGGDSSSFAPPSSSFNFGAQPTANPFSTNPTFGGKTESSTQSSVQAQSQRSEQGVTAFSIVFPKSTHPLLQAEMQQRAQRVPPLRVHGTPQSSALCPTELPPLEMDVDPLDRPNLHPHVDEMDVERAVNPASKNPFNSLAPELHGTLLENGSQGMKITDEIHTLDDVDGAPAHNPFQFSNSSSSASTIFANAGGPVQPLFSFGQPNSTAQTLQNSPSPFSFGQANMSTSSNPQQNTPFATSFGQISNSAQPKPSSNASATPQQNTTFTSAFGQPSGAVQPQTSSNSDVMMISPEKNASSPLGKSLFDRVEKPPADASSSPATTTTAPPPIFSFNQNAFPTADLQQSSQSSSTTNNTVPPPLFSFTQKAFPAADLQQDSQSPSRGTFEEDTISLVPAASMASDEKDPFVQSAIPTPSFLNHSREEATPPSDTIRSSSPTKASSEMAEPKTHVEDKPIHANLFNNHFIQQNQSSTVSSSTSLSSFAPTKQGGAVFTQPTGGIFGTLKNKEEHNTENAFPNFSVTPSAQGTNNIFNASGANHGAGKGAGENPFETQSPSNNKTGVFSNSSTEIAMTSQFKQTARNEGSSSPKESSDTAQNNSNQEIKTSNEMANASPHRVIKSNQRPKSKRKWIEPEPPEEYSTRDKQLYTLAWKLKQLDVGANAKLAAIVAAKETYKIKPLKKFYKIMEKRIWEEYGWMVKPPAVPKSSSPPATGSSRKRSYDQQNDNALSSTIIAPASHSTHQEPSQQQDNDSGRDSKWSRMTEDQQVSYPSLTNTTPNSNTSSMFKTILEKPTVTANIQSSTLSSPFAPKPMTTTSSALEKSSQDSSKLVPNPFADSIAKFRSGTSSGPSNDESMAKESAATPSTVFTIKPMTAASSASVTSGSAALKPPTFAQAKSNDFFKQFSQSSEDRARKEMEKRKEEEMSSEEDEAEWERRDAEQQRLKKQKLEQETSNLKPKFTLGQGFTFDTAQKDREEQSPAQEIPASDNYVHELDRQHAEYAKQRAAAASAPNPFTQLAKQDSGNEGSKSGDADDEQDGSDDEDKQTTTVEKPSGGSLFDRITAPASRTNKDAQSENPLEPSTVGINIFGNLSGGAASVGKFNTANQPATPAKTNIFGKLSSSTPAQNVFGTPSSKNPFKASGSAEKGDNTWNPDSPIKFGSSADASNKKRLRDEDDAGEGRENAKRADNKEAPAVNIISASPSKTPSNSLLFGTNLGTSTGTPGNNDVMPNAATAAGNLGTSFGFGISPLKPGPALGSLFPPSSNPSNGVSRSNSPGATTGESATESNADGDEEAEKHEQLNLTSSGPGEENEEVLYEVRAKASVWEEKEDEKGEKHGGWETRGLGPFRILKDKTTTKTRILMRSDPTGRIIINSSIFKGFKYDAPSKSTCRLPMLSESQTLETWVIKVGKDADAGKMARILEANKEQD